MSEKPDMSTISDTFVPRHGVPDRNENHRDDLDAMGESY
jgi:hypothetical protein